MKVSKTLFHKEILTALIKKTCLQTSHRTFIRMQCQNIVTLLSIAVVAKTASKGRAETWLVVSAQACES